MSNPDSDLSVSPNALNPMQTPQSSPDSEKTVDLVLLAQNRKRYLSGFRQSADRSIHLVRTYPPTQIARRLIKTVRNRMGWRYRPDNNPDEVRIRKDKSMSLLWNLTHGRTDVEFDTISSGKIRFLNRECHLGYPIDWRTSVDPRPSHLWRFQLHYHEFLLDLVSVANEATPENRPDADPIVWNIIDHWIRHNSPSDPDAWEDAWHPYCISRRIPVWLKLIAANPDHDEAIDHSLFAQADFLSKNLETDLRGNHLLENLTALAMAACYFSGTKSETWKRQTHGHLKKELAFQILASGEHYERSPMYQCVICANLLQLAIASQGVFDDVHQLAIDYGNRMYQFLMSTLHPDGEIPLLSDSCFGEAPSVAQITAYAESILVDSRHHDQNRGSQTVGSYWIHATDSSWLMFDAGNLAADGLPGHAHCDLLNLVGSIEGQRFLVDSGNGSYDLDATRTYCRSSVAHNVVTLDGQDHADVWSKFRMGFRGSPSRFRSGSVGEFSWATARHNAYRRIGIPSIHRFVACHNELPIWICADWIPKSAAPVAFEGFLHFGKEVDIVRHEMDLSANIASAHFNIAFFGCEKLELASGEIWTGFGRRSENWASVYSGTALESVLFGWIACPADIAHTTRHPQLLLGESENQSSLAIVFEGQTLNIDINPS